MHTSPLTFSSRRMTSLQFHSGRKRPAWTAHPNTIHIAKRHRAPLMLWVSLWLIFRTNWRLVSTVSMFCYSLYQTTVCLDEIKSATIWMVFGHCADGLQYIHRSIGSWNINIYAAVCRGGCTSVTLKSKNLLTYMRWLSRERFCTSHSYTW